MKKRIVSFLLALVMAVSLLPVSAFAVDGAYTVAKDAAVPLADDGTVTIKTPKGEGMTEFTLSVAPSNPNAAPSLTKYSLKGGPSVSFLYQYTYKVPAGTKSVTISFTSADPENGFFVESANGTVSFTDFMRLKAKPEDAITETTVTLTDGKGSTQCILPYLPSETGTSGGVTTIYNWSLNSSKGYQFHFEEESATTSLTKDLPERIAYNKDAAAEPLQVTVSAPEGSDIQYTWYQGATPETVTTVIDGANTNAYTPSADTVGVTYYRVEATVTEEGKNPVTLRSTATKFVVKDPDVALSFESWKIYDPCTLQRDADNEKLYTLKIPVDNDSISGYQDSKKIYEFNGTITGTIPDGVTFTRVWSGSPADELDLTKDGALTVDYDTNTFAIDLTKAARPEVADWVKGLMNGGLDFRHVLGRSLYLQTNDRTVYTIVADSESLNAQYRAYLPETVELVDQSSGTPLSDFQVQFPTDGSVTTSVIRKTLSANTPVVLRARVRNRDDGFVGHIINADSQSRFMTNWKESQMSWVVVNGQPVGGSFHGQTDAAEGVSPAFTLQPGWNVVEVYTSLESYDLVNNVGYTDRNGIRTPKLTTTCVVYLINYQGKAAANVPQDDAADTSLQEAQAVRFGPSHSYVTACPLRQVNGGYELTVPQTFNTDQGERTSFNEFTHAVLMAVKPKVPGATATFSGVDGLVVGECVADSAFLNMEALYGQTDKSFTITVTAADGKTTKDYPVKVVYASSVTTPEITVTGRAKLDVDFDENTYTYYLDYYDHLATNGYLNVSLPAGATAAVNDGEPFTGVKTVTVDPKIDFYRLTITAADNLTVKSYYFVTRYTKDGTVPYTTISAESKQLAKEMLWKYQETLESTEYFASYWNIFRAKAATGAEGIADYNFDGKYVMDPARHAMTYTTDWAACILEIVMLGRNPYDFPYYDNGEYVEHFDYVTAFRTREGSGAFASAAWYQFAAKAVGDPISGKMSVEQSFALNPNYEWLDIRAWAIASLAGSEPKDMVRYVDTLHNEQIKQGEFKSLWDQSKGVGNGTNPNTVGCVLSAIAAAGADPDKQFVYDGVKPLETIKKSMYREDGLFYSGVNSTQEGALSKDIIIGLGDVMHGSNVWDRYALTADKYNDLIAKANANGVSTADMPEFKEKDDASSRAYFALYQKVADAREKKGDTSMRPKVIFGMPHELFIDAVNAMPSADDLTTADLADLEALIKQYEAMDDASREAVVSVNAAAMTKYQELVAAGLKLKGSDNAAELYEKIMALPAAKDVTDANAQQVKADVAAIRSAMTAQDKTLLAWAGASVLAKLEAVADAAGAPKPSITVTFQLLGDEKHTVQSDADIHTYRFNKDELQEWIKTVSVTVPEGSTVGDVFKQVLDEKGYTYVGLEQGYISSITTPDKLKLTAKDDSGDNSGWMYLVNGKHADVGLNSYTLSGGEVITWHWCDDYTIEEGSEKWSGSRVKEYIENLIKLIGEVDTSTSCKARIDQARAAYAKLTEDEKNKISNYQTLVDAEAKYASLVQAEADKKAADEVIKLITDIGTVDKNSKSKIDAARKAYNELTDEQKKLVSNYQTLADAEAKYASLVQAEADKKAADAVIAKIDAIGTVTLKSKKAIDEARKAYDKLTAAQQARVSNYATLTAAETTYAKLVTDKADQDAADAVIAKIDAIGTVTLKSKKAIDAARKAYDKLTAAQQARVSNYAALTAAETTYAKLVQDKADQDAADAAIAKINAIGVVSRAAKSRIDAARKAYDGLTDAQKALVPASVVKTLTDAETAYSNLPPRHSSDDTADSTKPAQSSRTGDAGIAIYAAMSLLSVTGGAWVIGKKRKH